jgi:DnaK suppressor protein
MATTKTVKKTAQESTLILKRPASGKGTSLSSDTVAGNSVAEPDLKVASDLSEESGAVTVAAPSAAAPAAGGKWKEIQQILFAMKEQTLLEIKRSIKKGSQVSVGEEPTGDIYDQASSERDRELGLILNDREREKVHSIDEALLRIAEGEYGICEECDEEIPMGRLKVLPFTRHCVKCKSDLEKFQAQTRRIEEDRAYREIPVGDDDEG